MAYDLLIKRGRIYDGSGMPSYVGDVAVREGQIFEMIGTCFSGLTALDSNSECASPDKQPWGAREATKTARHGFPLFCSGPISDNELLCQPD